MTMSIGIIGAGAMGSGFARALGRAGIAAIGSSRSICMAGLRARCSPIWCPARWW
jgi:predicted dinucleotide-binding enzyme